MKKSFPSCVAVAAVLASIAVPAAAAAPKHRAPVFGNDTSNRQTVVPPANAVIINGDLIGADPDPNIRTQLLHDPYPDGF